MQVLRFCRSSYKFISETKHYLVSNPRLISGKVIMLLFGLMMFSHKCSQKLCAINFISQHLFVPPSSSQLRYRLCIFVSAFPSARSLPFFSRLLKRNGSVCHKKGFSLSACALDVDI